MIKKFLQFIRDVRQEMKYVSWPTKADIKESTTVVLVMAIIVGIFIAIVDNVFSQLIKLIAF